MTPAPVLDTHAWIWWVDHDLRLGRAALHALDSLSEEDRPRLGDIRLWGCPSRRAGSAVLHDSLRRVGGGRSTPAHRPTAADYFGDCRRDCVVAQDVPSRCG